MLEDLFHTLSWESRYHRFFTPLKSLSPEVLASFTQIDYDRDMALVALDQGGSSDKILGVARIMTTPGGTDPEFAVTVGDPWQGQGVGACLMDRLLAIARDRGLEYIWGIVLAENTQMLAMARKFGFTVKRAPGGREYELRIDLKSVPTS
jgi:acetyltransferase